MTRAMYDLQQYTNSSFVFGNVTYDHPETQAKPSIYIENPTEALADTYNHNGKIIFQEEERGSSEFQGNFNDELYLVSGVIMYDSLVNKDDLVIKEILSEFESKLKVNNYSPTSTWKWTIEPPTLYNNIPKEGEIEFTVKCRLRLVSATA